MCAHAQCVWGGEGGRPGPVLRLHRMLSAHRDVWWEPASAPRCSLGPSAPTLTLVPGWDCETSPDPPRLVVGARGAPRLAWLTAARSRGLHSGHPPAGGSRVLGCPAVVLTWPPGPPRPPCRLSAAVTRCHVGARPPPARSCSGSASGRQKARKQQVGGDQTSREHGVTRET